MRRTAHRPERALEGLTLLISGGIEGTGLAIATAAARQGVNVAFISRPPATKRQHDLRVLEAVETVEGVGARAVTVTGDLRSARQVPGVVQQTVDAFGGLDLLVINTDAMALDSSLDMPVERFDLLMQVNVRGTYLLGRAAIPRLRESRHAHMLTVSPPLNMSERWLGAHPPYTVSKYGMTLMTLGWAAEFAEDGIAANCLWPRSTVTSADGVTRVDGALNGSLAHGVRRPELMGAAAVEVLSRPPLMVSGRCLLDAEVLESAGVTPLPLQGEPSPMWELFVDPQPQTGHAG